MSLRRRVTVAVALAVAAVAVDISVAGYASTRSHLVGEVQQELREHAAPYLQPRGPEAGNAQEATGGGRDERGDHHAEQGFRAPPPPKFGGARGYFQVVHPDGTTTLPTGESVRLP